MLHFDPCPKRLKPTRKFWTGPKQFGLVQNRFGPIEGQGISYIPDGEIMACASAS